MAKYVIQIIGRKPLNWFERIFTPNKPIKQWVLTTQEVDCDKLMLWRILFLMLVCYKRVDLAHDLMESLDVGRKWWFFISDDVYINWWEEVSYVNEKSQL